jgi:sulfite exporter TauE/SafE
MLAFWTGTLPMMLAVGVGARRAFGPLQRRLPALAAASLVVIGALTISGRLVPRATHEHSPPAMDGGHAAR